MTLTSLTPLEHARLSRLLDEELARVDWNRRTIPRTARTFHTSLDEWTSMLIDLRQSLAMKETKS